VPATRTLAVVNRDHLPLASAQLATLPARNVVVQPRNRDTGPGILLPLLALARRSPDAPSQCSQRSLRRERRRLSRLGATAAELVAQHPEKIVL